MGPREKPAEVLIAPLVFHQRRGGAVAVLQLRAEDRLQAGLAGRLPEDRRGVEVVHVRQRQPLMSQLSGALDQPLRQGRAAQQRIAAADVQRCHRGVHWARRPS
ncbi:MAG: hypothetical protein AMJ81_10685 [Phycisphaerae bacterium SM23_33]|nr:MAG: hypothetical protein AMJ81_10685 [Phycisphaerae bacterium SM23_33]